MSALDVLTSDLRATAQVVGLSRDLVVQQPNNVTAMVGDAVRAKFEELAETIETEAAKHAERNAELQRWAKLAAAATREKGEAVAKHFREEAAAVDVQIEKLKPAKANGGEA